MSKHFNTDFDLALSYFEPNSKIKPRRNTCKMLDMVEQGLINKDDLINNLLNWMSEAEVTEFMEANEYE